MTTSIFLQTMTNHNNPIPINPWQDMTSSSNTTKSEKSIDKNNVDNNHQHDSGALLSNHDLKKNNNSTLWNRNTNTVVWTKQNFINRLMAPPNRQQSTTTNVWSKKRGTITTANIMTPTIHNIKQSSCPAQLIHRHTIALHL